MALLPAPELPVLDTTVMAAIRALGGPGEPDVYAQVAHLFLIDVPIHVSALVAAIAAGDSESVWQTAHRIRGSALEMGAVRMALLCAAIEHAARTGSLEHAAAQAESLERELAAARLELEQAIGDGVTSPGATSLAARDAGNRR
jgi:HPt (histidine-containing phosphotransfer) domain-containing protein